MNPLSMATLTPPLTPPLRKPAMSAARASELAAIQRVASTALQTRSVSVDPLDDGTFRVFRLRSSPGYFYVLRCRPMQHVRLLRHEEERLSAEADALTTLRSRSNVITSRLIEYNSSTRAIGSAYLISGPFMGAVLADIEPSLSKQTLANIDRSVGQFVRQFSSTCGSTFGPVCAGGASSSTTSWTRCFAGLLETVLRDGEDALINLPYEGIRDQVRRHRASLDQITQPRLMLVEMASDRNIVVDESRGRVSGLLDLSTAIWGDPFMSDCFYKPSISFAEGFGKLPNKDVDERIRQYL